VVRPTASSRGEAVGSPEKERRVADGFEAEQDHEHAVESHSQAAGGGKGVDVALEAVGDPSLAATAFAALAPGGQAVIVGMMPPDSQIAVPAALLRHGRRLAGSVMGEVRSLHDIPAYLRMVAGGQLIADELATSRWPLDGVNEAFDHASARRGVRTMIEF
jgi:Zn-dependent alcohol dehydrogenase